MAETNTAPQASQPAPPKNLFWTLVTLPMTLFGVLCASLLMSIIVECVGIHFFWKSEGWHHAEAMFQYELGQFAKDYQQSLIVSEPVTTTQRVLDKTYQWVFIKSGIKEKTNAALMPKNSDRPHKKTFKEYLSMAFDYLHTYVLATAYTALTFVLRLMVLVLSLPMVLLALFVGSIDGLARRDIRHFTGGHESGFVYHRVRSLLLPAAVLPSMIYLALPVSISPLLVLVPGAVALGTLVDLTAASFKKYL